MAVTLFLLETEKVKDLINQDTNGDGICDLNCDKDGDGICDLNCVKITVSEVGTGWFSIRTCPLRLTV